MKNIEYIYTAVFIPEKALAEAVASHVRRGTILSGSIHSPHVTVSYKPESVYPSLFGENVCIKVTGYGNDGKNEGLLVQPSSSNPQLQALMDERTVQHITLAVGDGGRPVDTRYLDFSSERVEPFELVGTYGGYLSSGAIDFGK